jgi:phosphoribosyl 1,2-cyclic phosphate phosphodiesterase
MKLRILGTGASVYFPRPCCECELCEKARKQGPPHTRTGTSLYNYDEAILFDTPEDIYYQLERDKIRKVKHVFYTHWHPDHTQGERIFEHINFTYAGEKQKEPINVYVPEEEYPDFEKLVPHLFYYQSQGWIRLHKIKDRKPVKIGKISVTPVNFLRSDRQRFGFLIEEGKKRFMYAPCSIFQAKIDKFWEKLDLLIIELGWFGNPKTREKLPEKHCWRDHISLEEDIALVKKIKPKRTLLTHLEGTHHVSLEEAQKEIAPYKKLNVEPATDGMQIEL